MATSKKLRTIRVPDKAGDLLVVLGRGYDFGPAMNKRIQDAILNETRNAMQGAAEALTKIDPLAYPPGFLGDRTETGLTLQVPRVVTNEDHRQRVAIRLGVAHGFDVILYHYPHTRATYLIVGCREFKTGQKAREHWYGNTNRQGTSRPYATQLIDYVASICNHRGWTW